MRKISSTLSTLFIGHMANFIMVEWFDFILYPAILLYFGLVKGAIIMWILSFIVCYGTIVFYNWSKKDWLGIELVKETLDRPHTSYFLRALAWANRHGKLVALTFLSVTTDPFICVIYMRKNSHGYHKMTERDWRVFMVSFVISNIWWTTIMYTGVTVLTHVYNYAKISTI